MHIYAELYNKVADEEPVPLYWPSMNPYDATANKHYLFYARTVPWSQISARAP